MAAAARAPPPSAGRGATGAGEPLERAVAGRRQDGGTLVRAHSAARLARVPQVQRAVVVAGRHRGLRQRQQPVYGRAVRVAAPRRGLARLHVHRQQRPARRLQPRPWLRLCLTCTVKLYGGGQRRRRLWCSCSCRSKARGWPRVQVTCGHNTSCKAVPGRRAPVCRRAQEQSAVRGEAQRAARLRVRLERQALLQGRPASPGVVAQHVQPASDDARRHQGLGRMKVAVLCLPTPPLGLALTQVQLVCLGKQTHERYHWLGGELQ